MGTKNSTIQKPIKYSLSKKDGNHYTFENNHIIKNGHITNTNIKKRGHTINSTYTTNYDHIKKDVKTDTKLDKNDKYDAVKKYYKLGKYNDEIKKEDKLDKYDEIKKEDKLDKYDEIKKEDKLDKYDEIMKEDKIDKYDEVKKEKKGGFFNWLFSNKYNDVKKVEYTKKNQIVCKIKNEDEMHVIKTSSNFGGNDISINGSDFNEIYKNINFVKLTNYDCINNKYFFREGLNVDTNKFLTDRAVGEDGLYFCKEDNFIQWIFSNRSKPKYWLWDVIIPDDAKVVIMNNSIKANKIILSNKRKISDEIKSIVLSVLYSNFSHNKMKDELSKIPLSIFNQIEDKSLINYKIIELGLDVNLIMKK